MGRHARSGPALPLGELGNCLSPQWRGAQNFKKERVIGEKINNNNNNNKIISDGLQKSGTSFNQNTKILINPVKH